MAFIASITLPALIAAAVGGGRLILALCLRPQLDIPLRSALAPLGMGQRYQILSHAQFSHRRRFFDSRNVQKCVTQIIYLGPLPTRRQQLRRCTGTDSVWHAVCDTPVTGKGWSKCSLPRDPSIPAPGSHAAWHLLKRSSLSSSRLLCLPLSGAASLQGVPERPLPAAGRGGRLRRGRRTSRNPVLRVIRADAAGLLRRLTPAETARLCLLCAPSHTSSAVTRHILRGPTRFNCHCHFSSLQLTCSLLLRGFKSSTLKYSVSNK